jgi:hypothetical protein
MKIAYGITGVLAAAATAGTLVAAAAIPAQAAASAPAAPAQSAMMGHLGAALHGSSAYRSVRGHADYMSYRRHELDVSIWNARRLSGHKLTVYVHGSRAGTMTVWRGGSAHMNRHHGVPACSPGSSIRIRTSSGTLVASGTFHRMGMM